MTQEDDEESVTMDPSLVAAIDRAAEGESLNDLEQLADSTLEDGDHLSTTS